MLHPIILEDAHNVCNAVVHPDALYDAKILISGATGFIASSLIYSLLHLNDIYSLNMHIYGLTRSLERMLQRFGDLMERHDFDAIVGDISQPLNIDFHADWVIHAASQTAPAQFQYTPVDTIITNVQGMIHLLEYAAAAKTRGFLLLSTREVYGSAVKDYVQEKDFGGMDPATIRACYPESKRMNETLCAAYRSQFGLDCRIARIAHCYGPGMRLSDGRVVGDFIGDIVKGRDIVMNSDGSGTLALTYISDVVIGLIGIMTQYPDWSYNISNDREVLSVRELAERLCRLCPDDNRRVITKMLTDGTSAGYLKQKIGYLSSDKARADGWYERVTLDAGLLRTIKYFKEC